MRKILYGIFINFLFVTIAQSQAPLGINYQGIAYDGNGLPISSKTIAVRLSVVSGSASGPVVFSETHSPATNDFGLFSLVIGKGQAVSSSFGNINWTKGDMFIRVEIDPANGANYVNLGTTQLLSVPFALFAAKSGDLQQLSFENDSLKISNGNSVKLGLDSLINKNHGIKIGTTSVCNEGTLRYNDRNKKMQYCNGTKWVTISGFAAASISLAATVVTEYGTSKNGSIDLTVSGGDSPFTYKWSNGAITEDISGLQAGSYKVTVKDANLDSASSTFEVTRSGVTVTDPDGNVYNAATVGTQLWMTEDLKTTKNTSGQPVTTYCYGDDSQNCLTGRLYRTYEIYEVCPTGWRVPTDNDWKILEKYLGMSDADANTMNAFRGTDQGTKLKVDGSTEINLQLNGYYDDFTSTYKDRDVMGAYWSSTDNIPAVVYRYVSATEGRVGRAQSSGKRLAIRCMRDN